MDWIKPRLRSEATCRCPSGLCPACLLKAGLLGDDSQLLDVTIKFGPASSSVLVPGTPCLND